jgi:hypothetical protein
MNQTDRRKLTIFLREREKIANDLIAAANANKSTAKLETRLDNINYAIRKIIFPPIKSKYMTWG